MSHLGDFVFEFLHAVHLLHHLLTFAFSLFLQLLPALDLALTFDFLLFLFLHFHDAIVHLDQQVRQLGIDLVDQVGKVSGCLVVNVLEEHHCVEIFRKVLHLALRQLPIISHF